MSFLTIPPNRPPTQKKELNVSSPTMRETSSYLWGEKKPYEVQVLNNEKHNCRGVVQGQAKAFYSN